MISILFCCTYKHDLLTVSYQVVQNDSVMRNGSANELGFIHFNLKSTEQMLVYVQSKTAPRRLKTLAQFLIDPSEQPKDFVIYANGLAKYSSFISARIESYPIIINGKRNAFELKINKKWTTYSQVKV